MIDNPSRREVTIALGTVFALTALPNKGIAAAPVIVDMYNRDPDDKKRRMLFKPLIQVIEPGQTVRFVATDKGHNSASIKGMIPEGATPWNGKLNKDIEVTFEKPGFYGYKCSPHYSIGMVGLIVVKGEGMMDNLEAAMSVKGPGRAKKVFKEIWATAKADGLLG